MSEQIFPPIGASNVTVINTPLPTEDVSDGTTGNPVPTTAIQVGGSDGTNLQALQVDGSKNLKVIVENTDYSTSTNQTNGNQKTQVVDGSGNIQPSGDTPARSIQVEVTDGTNVLGTSSHPIRIDPVGTTNQPVNVAEVNGATPNLAQETGGNLDSILANQTNGTQKTQSVFSYVIKTASGVGDATGAALTVPANKQWKIKAINVKINTSATAGTRNIGITFTSGSFDSIIYAPLTISASDSKTFLFAPSVPTATAFTNNHATVGYPEIVLPAGQNLTAFLIVSGTPNFSTDTISVIASVEEYNM